MKNNLMYQVEVNIQLKSTIFLATKVLSNHYYNLGIALQAGKLL